jgi:hypothetical protein
MACVEAGSRPGCDQDLKSLYRGEVCERVRQKTREERILRCYLQSNVVEGKKTTGFHQRLNTLGIYFSNFVDFSLCIAKRRALLTPVSKVIYYVTLSVISLLRCHRGWMVIILGNTDIWITIL